jgi:class 3 adenylate cyclase
LIETHENIKRIGIEHEPADINLDVFFNGLSQNEIQVYNISVNTSGCVTETNKFRTQFTLVCEHRGSCIVCIFKWTQSDKQQQTLLKYYIHRYTNVVQSLLPEIYPPHVLPSVLIGNFDVVWPHTNIFVAYIDIAGYTTQSAINTGMFTILNGFYSEVQRIARIHDITIVEIEGDAIIIAKGLESAVVPVHLCPLFTFVFQVIEHAATLGLCVRCGLAKGRAMSGVIRAGQCRYRLLGDVVNVAARLQSIASPSSLLITEILHQQATADPLLCQQFVFKAKSSVFLKGRGYMNTHEVRLAKKTQKHLQTRTMSNPQVLVTVSRPRL